MSSGEFRADFDQEANKLLGEAVAELRQRANLTQAGLAARAEMREQEIAEVEKGRLEPTWGDLRRIAYALEVPLPELLARAEGD